MGLAEGERWHGGGVYGCGLLPGGRGGLEIPGRKAFANEPCLVLIWWGHKVVDQVVHMALSKGGVQCLKFTHR